MKRLSTRCIFYKVVFLCLLLLPVISYSQITFPATPAFTELDEDDGFGGTKKVYQISIPSGTMPISYDFNVTGVGLGESWSISSQSCTPSPCGGIATGVTSTGILSVTPNGVGTVEFVLTASPTTGAPSSSINLRFLIRKAIDLVLVLDKSGSMSTTSGTTTRWNALATAVQAFTDKFEAFKLDGDRLTITYFHSVVEDGLGGSFINITDPTTLPSSKTQVAASLGLHGPAGMTAMGEGLLKAKMKLTPATPNKTRIILLFTDGYQNWPNDNRLVDISGIKLKDGTAINDGTGAGSISIYTIGIGAAGSLPAILSQIASHNRGLSWVTQTGAEPTFVADFTNAFKEILSQFSPQIIGTKQGTLKPGSQSDSVTFMCNRDIDKLIFELYSPGRIQAVIEKDGAVRSPSYIARGSGYQMLVFKSPHNDPGLKVGGMWKVKINSFSQGISVSSSTAPATGYSLIVIGDDHRTDYTCSPGADSFKVGQVLKPLVQFDYAGKAVTNGLVNVLLLRPGQTLGNLLATTSVNLDTTKGLDTASAGIRKYNQLLNDPAFLAKMLPKEQSKVLTHSATGKYETSFGAVDTSGVYRIIFFLNDTLPGGQVIQRREEQSFYVQFGDVDLPASQPALTGTANQWVLNIRPKTSQNLFVGPGFQQAFGLTGSGISLKNVEDMGDGTYRLMVEGNPDALVNLTLLGVKVYEGKLSKIGDTTGGNFFDQFPRWLLWLLIALLVLLLLWWLLKKKK